MTRLVLPAAVVASAALLSAESAAAFQPTSDRRAALADVAKLLGGAVAAGTVLPRQASAGLGNPVRLLRCCAMRMLTDIMFVEMQPMFALDHRVMLSRTQHVLFYVFYSRTRMRHADIHFADTFFRSSL